MAQSSQFCRTQQALHEARAASATLVNVKRVSLIAATAWEREGNLAAATERRRAGASLSPGDAAIAAEFRAEELPN
jgi:hypothetical protein